MPVPIERAVRDSRLRAADLLASLNPDEVSRGGAAVQAGLRARDAALSERVMTDVCPTEVQRRTDAGEWQGGLMESVLPQHGDSCQPRAALFSGGPTLPGGCAAPHLEPPVLAVEHLDQGIRWNPPICLT